MTRNLSKNSMYTVDAVIATALAIAGCNKGTPQQPVQPPKQAENSSKPVQKPVSSTVKQKVKPSVQFDFSTKRDPFKPYADIKPIAKKSAVETKRALIASLPIHSFDVSQFRLIGVVTDQAGNRAMVVDPNGKGYVLRNGMSIGKNDGKVTSITMVGVNVLEQFVDDNGKVRKENITIPLPKKQ